VHPHLASSNSVSLHCKNGPNNTYFIHCELSQYNHTHMGYTTICNNFFLIYTTTTTTTTTPSTVILGHQLFQIGPANCSIEPGTSHILQYATTRHLVHEGGPTGTVDTWAMVYGEWMHNTVGCTFIGHRCSSTLLSQHNDNDTSRLAANLIQNPPSTSSTRETNTVHNTCSKQAFLVSP
jgi:hypothetical protein